MQNVNVTIQCTLAIYYDNTSSYNSESVIVDLVPRSRFGGSRTKNRGRGEGKGEEETRSGKIRIETSADWLFNIARESSTRVFISFAHSAENMPRRFTVLKKI